MLDLRGESDATKKLYGLDLPDTSGFARNCLTARRMIERGVEFGWHSNIEAMWKIFATAANTNPCSPAPATCASTTG